MSNLVRHDDEFDMKPTDKNIDIIESVNIEKGKEITKNLYTKLTEMKTKQCKHPSGWTVNALSGFVKNFAYGYSFKTLVKILFLLIKKKNYWRLTKILTNKDSLLFGLFLGLLWGIYKSSNWALRWARKKEDGYNSIFSGVLSSLSAVFNNPESRQSNILYVFSRNVEVIAKLLDSKGVIKEPKHWGLVLYIISITFIVYLLYFEKELAPKFAVKNVKTLAWLKPNEVIFKDLIWNMMK